MARTSPARHEHGDEHLRIAIVINRANGVGREMLRGLRRLLSPTTPWVLHVESSQSVNLPLLRAWKPAGMIVEWSAVGHDPELLTLTTKVVDVSNAGDPSLARVGVDNHAVGVQAAEYYMSLGHGSFAFVGRPSATFSRERRAGFTARLLQSGFKCAWYDAEPEHAAGLLTESWITDRAFCRWLQALPRPLAALTPNDDWGLKLIEVCRTLKLRMPEDVSVLGVGNDDVTCDLACPPMSSVRVPGERIGFEAAQLLAGMLRAVPSDGDTGPPVARLLPPLGVTVRHSTDLIAIDDPEVSQAIRYIRDNADRPLTVDALLEAVPISRRRLERRFRELLGRSPYQEITRVHIDLARTLLAGSELPMPDVAARSGFPSARKLSEAFGRLVGITPSKFRQNNRTRGGVVID